MRRTARKGTALAGFLLLACTAGRAALIEGTWTFDSERKQLTLRRANVIINPTAVLTLPPDEAPALVPAKASPEAGVVEFEVARDAGSVQCTGVLRGGRGEGAFLFQPNPAFLAALRELVTDWWDSGKIYDLAIADVPLAAVQRLHALGYRNLHVVDLVRLQQAGATADVLPTDLYDVRRQPAPSVSRLSELEKARMRAAGANAGYWKRLLESGYALFPDDAIRLRTHGVSPEFLRQMKRSGYDSLSVTDMIKLQTYGVTIHDVQLFEARGQKNLSADDIVKLKTGGVQ